MEQLQLFRKSKSKSKFLNDIVIPFLSAKKDTKVLHKLYSYPAKFQGRLPESLINNLTSEGDLVLDAFSGGGTTSVEALLSGRNSYAMDLNPISIVISKAKTIKLKNSDYDELEEKVLNLKAHKRISFLNEDEEWLMGEELASFSSSVISLIRRNKNKNWSYLLTAVLIKRVKLSTRRDKTHLRTASFEKHIDYILNEIRKVKNEMINTQISTRNTIEYGSNHDIDLKNNSVDLIITSPPYPNVDIEYNLIQLQRRDLKKCYRSDIAQRLCSDLLGTPASPSKKELCNGGVEHTDYWTNAELSLKEMRRVLKKEHLCFLYIGFKTDEDREMYEEIVNKVGFKIAKCYSVELGKERVASSRGLYHGKETKMMKKDFLYVLG